VKKKKSKAEQNNNRKKQELKNNGTKSETDGKINIQIKTNGNKTGRTTTQNAKSRKRLLNNTLLQQFQYQKMNGANFQTRKPYG